MKDRIAIVGFGASGYGTYLSLKKKGYKYIDIYNSSNISFNEQKNLSESEIYYNLRKKYGTKNLFNKSNYLNTPYFIADKKTGIYENNINGGLLSYWGGVVQKFETSHLKKNFGTNSFEEYYNDVFKHIPHIVVGETKSNNSVKKNSVVQKLITEREVNKNVKFFDPIISMQINESSNSQNCTCFVGCNLHQIFCATKHIKKKETVINDLIDKIDFDRNTIFTSRNKTKYDKIYITTGPYNTQKIINKSYGNFSKDISIKDSFSFTFPIYYKGYLDKNTIQDFLLTNSIAHVFKNDDLFANVQIYPPNKHIYNSLLPPKLWKSLDFLNKISFDRILYARCYLEDKFSVIKTFTPQNDVKIQIDKKLISQAKKTVYKEIKKTLNNKFITIPVFLNSKTSSHYAGNLSEDEKVKYKTISKDIFVNDSVLWQYLPSSSPTLTIITNAYRNTEDSA